ncbi:MAG: flavodoxin family protein [Actinomycetota bacterium]|nr:flavodoxin family protein [Actinomycetota bacterium]
MLVVGLNGSPNQDGNTAYVINAVLQRCAELGAETEIIHVMDALAGQEQVFCVACGTPCPEKCHRVENLSSAQKLLQRADALVVGSPVYFGTISAPLKAFWDKSRNLRSKKALVGKLGCAVAVGAARFGGQETTLRAIHDILLVHGMVIIGDCSSSGAGHQGVCASAPAQEDKFALGRARILAEGIVELTG